MSEASGGLPVHAGNRSTDADAPDDRGYRKLCGTLTEMEGEADYVSRLIIGSGVNINLDPAEFPEVTTSVAAEANPVERRVFVQRVLERFDALRSDLGAVLPAWHEQAGTLGKWVRVHTASGVIEGDAADIERPDMLVVSTNVGEKRVHADDCEYLCLADDGR